MTVRQVFYQMSTRGYIPKTEKAYKGVVCRLLGILRLEGTIPFGWISDNTRWMRKPITHDGMESVLYSNMLTYRRALWTRMPCYVEVWIEKDALAGVLYDVTEVWDVPLMVTRGYPSLTYVYEAAEAMKGLEKPAYIYYLGDYDPSGVDISRSLEKRLREFAPGSELHFERLAVNELQIKEYGLLTRPTKKADSRSAKFTRNGSVELDAMPPQLIREIVGEAIRSHVDVTEMLKLEKIEKAERDSFRQIYETWKQHTDVTIEDTDQDAGSIGNEIEDGDGQ